MLHAVSHHYLHTYPGGLDALYLDQPHFVNNHGWIKHGSEELKIQFEVNFLFLISDPNNLIRVRSPTVDQKSVWLFGSKIV